MIDKRLKYLKNKAPKGEFLAYINAEEAAMLKRAGGSGKKVNGIPSFRPQDMGNAANQAASANNPGIGGGGAADGPGDTGGEGGNNPSDDSDSQNSGGGGGYNYTGPADLGVTTRTVNRITAPPSYEIIGGKKFDVTPDTKDDRERARVKQSILDAPIPNITDKGTSFFKDGNLLNSFLPGDNPLSKPKFSVGNLLFNAGMFAISPALFAKYQKGKRLYSGAKFVTDTFSKITNKNLSKPFETVENLTKNIGLKDKNVIQSFKDSFTNNLTSKTKTKTKTKPVINTDTDNNRDGIASLENANVLQDEYSILFQKLQTGNISDAERTRYTMLKNMLGI